MPSPRDRERPTHVLVAAANLLQALSPSKVGLLLTIYDNDLHTQKELSDLVGRTQSTISTYLQSLSTLSPPLAAKGKHYIVTNTGEKVLGLVNDMARRCDLELRSVDWTDETDRQAVEALLTPLHDSQIVRPIFILDSLYERSDIDGPLGSPQPIRFTDIVHDVERRQDEIGKSATTEEIRRTVRQRFDNTDAAHFENGRVTLTHKGHQQAWLLHDLGQYLEGRSDVGSGDDGSAEVMDTETSTKHLESLTTSLSSSDSSTPRTSGVDSSHNNVIPINEREQDLDQASVIPVFTLQRERLDSGPVLPLTGSMSVKDLVVRANQLANEYGEETELELNWMVQTESGLYPLSTADSSKLGIQKPHNK